MTGANNYVRREGRYVMKYYLLHKKRAFTSEKPCINKEFHVPLMHRYLTFHIQDSGQYSINTEEASRLQLKLSI